MQADLLRNNEYSSILKIIAESFSDGLIIVDNNGILSYINDIGAEMLNLDRNAVREGHVSTIVDFKPIHGLGISGNLKMLWRKH